jgi:RNA polymerase sigma-70 factor, ECF subfamily
MSPRALTAAASPSGVSPEQSQRAFADLYRQYAAPVYRYAYSRVGNQADAEDVTAQTFTEALAGLDRYREQGTFAAWLFTIAARRIVDHYRQSRPQLPLDALSALSAVHALNADGRSPLSQAIHNETMAELTRLVSQLPDEKQELLRLRFAAELTYAEIGGIVGRSEAAVKMAVNRLLRQLETALTAATQVGE